VVKNVSYEQLRYIYGKELPLDPSQGNSLNKLFLGKEEDNQDRCKGKQRDGHQLVIIGDVLTTKEIESKRQRIEFLFVDVDQWTQEVVPVASAGLESGRIIFQ